MTDREQLHRLVVEGERFRSTPIVDDDFITVRDAFDTELARAHEHHKRAMSKPRIVCLCGSTRFMAEFYDANMRETLAGKIVLTVGMSSKGDCKPTDEQKVALDELHKRKIDLADEVLILNVGGYIGDSTRGEVRHAVKSYKPIRWLEEDKIPPEFAHTRTKAA
jgi:hypothetical protein